MLQYCQIRYSPELLTEPHIVAKVDRGRFPLDRPFQQAHHRSLRVGVERPNGAEVRLAGFEQIQPICFGGRACILVRVDKSRIERFQFYSGEKALESFRRRTGRSRGRCVFDRMVVEGRLRVAFQHPALEPVAQGQCGAGVSIMSWTVAWLIEPQFESNDVLWMAIVQSLLPSRIDDVVGRRHDLFDIPYNRRIVPRAMKRNDLGHGGFLAP